MKILIIHTAFIGDIVLSTPLIKSCKDKYNEAKLDYLTTPAGAAILENNPYLNNIIIYDKHGKNKGFFEFVKLCKKIKKEKYDMVITPHRYARSSILSMFSFASQKIGYDISPFSWIYNKKIKYDKSKHEVEKLLSFLDIKDCDDPKIELYPSDENYKNIEKLIEIDNKKIVIIAPGSKWATKQWPLQYFNEVIKYLSNKNCIVGIIGGEEEKKLDIKFFDNTIDLRGKTSLLDLAAVISKSSFLLTNDSAPVHIASAFEKVKIMAIFGPTVKEFGFFPYSKNSKVYEVRGLKCRPCGIHGGNICKNKDFRCMRAIEPQLIIKDLEKELDDE